MELSASRRTTDIVVRIARVSLGRISWMVTVGLCVVAALLLALNGFSGYAGVLIAVAAAAAVNLA